MIIQGARHKSCNTVKPTSEKTLLFEFNLDPKTDLELHYYSQTKSVDSSYMEGDASLNIFGMLRKEIFKTTGETRKSNQRIWTQSLK